MEECKEDISAVFTTQQFVDSNTLSSSSEEEGGPSSQSRSRSRSMDKPLRSSEQIRCILPEDLYEDFVASAEDGSSPEPLFSPTARKNVLHSIFSQDDQTFSSPKGQLVTTVATVTNKTPKQSRNNKYSSSNNNAPSTNLSSTSSQQEAFFTPRQQQQQEPENKSQRRTTTTSPYSAVSFLATPTSLLTSRGGGEGGGSLTAGDESSNHSSSFRFDTLNYEFIQNCNCAQTLRDMQAYLKVKGRYPALLCETQKRLTELYQTENARSGTATNTSSSMEQQQQQQQQHHDVLVVDTNQRNLSYRALPLSTPRESDEESSLVMSLSTDRFSEIGSTILSISPILPNRYETSSYSNSKAVERLKERLLSMTNRLKETEQKAHETIQILQGDVAKTSAQRQELQTELEQVGSQKERLQGILQQEREHYEQRARKDAQCQGTLQNQVATLQEQLQTAEERARENMKRQQQSLEQNLQTTRRNLESAERERDVMLLGLQRANGNGVKKDLSSGERRQLILDFLKSSSTSKAAIDATARALARSERYRQKEKQQTSKMQQEYEKQLRVAGQTITALEREVDRLQYKMQELSKELAESRASHKKDRNQWKQNETDRRRKEIVASPAVVPMGLFKHVKTESEERRKQIQNLQTKIAQLEEKSQLQNLAPFDRSLLEKSIAFGVIMDEKLARLQESNGSSSGSTTKEQVVKGRVLPAQPPPRRKVLDNKIAQLQEKSSSKETASQQAAKGRNLPAKTPPPRRNATSTVNASQQVAQGRALLAKSPLLRKKNRVAFQLSSAEKKEDKPSVPSSRLESKQDGHSSARKIHFAQTPKPPPKRENTASDRKVRFTTSPRELPVKALPAQKAKTTPVPSVGLENRLQAVNGNSSTPNGLSFPRKVSFASPSEDSSRNKKSVRFSMVRQAGGRKGLQEQLKRVRSPRPFQPLDPNQYQS